MDDLNLGETSLLNRLIRFCLENKLIVVLLVLAVAIWGLLIKWPQQPRTQAKTVYLGGTVR